MTTITVTDEQAEAMSQFVCNMIERAPTTEHGCLLRLGEAIAYMTLIVQSMEEAK